MAGIFALIVSLSFIYTLYLQIFSTDSKRTAVFARALFYASIAGALCLVASSLIFYVRIASIDNAELYGNLRDAFTLFAYIVSVEAALPLIVTTIVHFIGKKMAAIVPAVCHLASLSVLIFTVIFAALGQSFQDGIAINVYMSLFGSSLSLINLFPASLELKRLSALLLDKNYVRDRLHRREEKQRKAEGRKQERKRIKETKNRIKNSTKK